MAGGTVAVRFTGDVSNLKKALGETESRLSKFGAGLAKFGKFAAVGTAAGGAGVVALGNEVLTTGGKLESFRLKTKTVFEGSAGDIRKWADQNNEVFGLTDDELAGLAANFGDLLKPMGFTADQAAGMAKDVVGLSGALSEWTGGQRSAEEVSVILSKAMLGERESLKELGISIMEADVQARLAAKGQEKLTGSALEQAKAIATQELIFEKSTDAQAAFAAGGNKALRAQNALKAGLQELREQVADRLLPVATKLAQWAADALPKAMDWAERAVGRFMEMWNQAWPTISAVFQQFQSVVKTVIEFVSGLFKKSEGDVGGSSSKLAKTVGDLGKTIATVFEAIKVAIEVTVTVVMELWERFGDDITKFAKAAFDNLLQIISGVLSVIQGVLNVFIGIFTGDWSRAWEGVKSIASGALNILLGIVKTGLEWVKVAFAVAWGAVKDIVATKTGELLGFVQSIPSRLLAGLGNLGSILWDAGKALIQGLINGIKNQAGRAVDAVKDVGKQVIAATTGVFKIRSPSKVFADIGGQVGAGLVEGLDGMKRSVSRAGEMLAGSAVPSVPTMALAGGAATATPGNTYSITINALDTSDGTRKVIDIIESYERRNGRR